jgi:hypothetical protein
MAKQHKKIQEITQFVSETEIPKGKPTLMDAVILGIIVIVSILITFSELAADVAEDVGEVGTAGLATPVVGTADLVFELIAESLQDIIAAGGIIAFGAGSKGSKTIKISIIVFMSLINLITSVVSIVIPFFSFAKTIVEFFTDVIINGILIWSFIGTTLSINE